MNTDTATKPQAEVNISTGGNLPARQTPVQAFIARVLDGEKEREIRLVLPEHVPFERFKRNLSNAVMRDPKLLRIHPSIVFREVAKIAALGLLLDPFLGEAYLIADHKGDVQARIGYRGLIKLAEQSGEVSAIYAHDVCENDEREISLGTDKKLIHKPDYMRPRGNVGAYYAVVRFKDGSTDFEPMSLEEIHKIRDKSDAWRAFKNGKIKSTPWSSDEGEMCKKTVLRRLMKRVRMSPDLDSALAHEDAADVADRTIDAVAVAPRTLQGKLDALAEEPTYVDVTEYDPETGEIFDGDVGDAMVSSQSKLSEDGDTNAADAATEAGVEDDTAASFSQTETAESSSAPSTGSIEVNGKSVKRK